MTYNSQLQYSIGCLSYQDATGKLVTVPTTVNAFINFLSEVQLVKAHIPVLGSTLKIITSLYNVAQHFNVHITEQELALYKSLFPLYRYLEVSEAIILLFIYNMYVLHLLISFIHV